MPAWWTAHSSRFRNETVGLDERRPGPQRADPEPGAKACKDAPHGQTGSCPIDFHEFFLKAPPTRESTL